MADSKQIFPVHRVPLGWVVLREIDPASEEGTMLAKTHGDADMRFVLAVREFDEESKLCGFDKKPCIEHRCVHYHKVRGKHPQSDEEIDKYDCAFNWMIPLTIENSAFVRQSGAAVESFRNEMVKFSLAELAVSVGRGEVGRAIVDGETEMRRYADRRVPRLAGKGEGRTEEREDAIDGDRS